MTPPVLVIAIGNESRGDDALAPVLLRRLRAWVAERGLAQDIELIEDFQLQIEHAADLVGRQAVLFMDAGMGTPAPYEFWRAEPDADPTPFSHALDPEAVLATYVQVYRETPPPAYVLCLRGEQFELGSPLSAAAAARIEPAQQFVQGLLLDGARTWGQRGSPPL